MERPVVRVVPLEGKWAVQLDGENNHHSEHRLQVAAIMFGRELARERQAEFIIHQQDGRVRSIRRYAPVNVG